MHLGGSTQGARTRRNVAATEWPPTHRIGHTGHKRAEPEPGHRREGLEGRLPLARNRPVAACTRFFRVRLKLYQRGGGTRRTAPLPPLLKSAQRYRTGKRCPRSPSRGPPTGVAAPELLGGLGTRPPHRSPRDHRGAGGKPRVVPGQITLRRGDH